MKLPFKIVYLMADLKDQSFKVGISNNPYRRKKEVGIWLVFWLPFLRPLKAEQFIHNVFSRWRTYRPEKSGGTEFFRHDREFQALLISLGFAGWLCGFDLGCWIAAAAVLLPPLALFISLAAFMVAFWVWHIWKWITFVAALILVIINI